MEKISNYFRKYCFYISAYFLFFAIEPFNAYTEPHDLSKSETEMVFVKGGCFKMGDWVNSEDSDANPVHTVCVDDFYIGKYEVTQRLWVEIMGYNPSYHKGCDNCPIDNVSWYDAQQFINKLNKKTGKKYRLPTEAEWEYTARSRGKKEIWAGTNNVSKLEEYAWFLGVTSIKNAKRKKPNGLGIHNMTGTVWEWVEDWYYKDYYKESPKDNPKGPPIGEWKVLRGGCWLDDPMYAATYTRHAMPPDIHDTDAEAGLRLVISADVLRKAQKRTN